MNEEFEFAQGCEITPPDERDYPYGILASASTVIPERFSVEIPFWWNQKQIDSCVGQGVGTAKSIQEKKELSPRFLWALTKAAEEYMGWGTSFRGLFNQLKEVGVVPFGRIDENCDVSRDQYMRVELTPELRAEAEVNKALSYWRPRGWESVKQALVEQKIPLVTMCEWMPEFNYPKNGFISPPTSKNGLGHLFVFRGFDKTPEGEEYAIFRNSWGKNWGVDGDFYVKVKDLEAVGIFVFFVLVDVPQANIVGKYDGKLIKNPNKPEVYFVKKGKIAWIPNEKVFEFGRDAGFWGNWPDIITIDQEIKPDLTF